MSAYNKTISILKTVEHDTTFLDAQKILIYPGGENKNERKNILDILNDRITESLPNLPESSLPSSSNFPGFGNLLDEFYIYDTSDTSFKTKKDSPTTVSNCDSLYFDSSHCPYGIINKISFYSGPSYDAYLIAEIWESKDNIDTLVKTYKSDSSNKNEWEFSKNPFSLNKNQWLKLYCEDTLENKIAISCKVNNRHVHTNCGYKLSEDGNIVKSLPFVTFEGIFYKQKYINNILLETNILQNCPKISAFKCIDLIDASNIEDPQDQFSLTEFALGRSLFKNGIYSSIENLLNNNNYSPYHIKMRLKDNNYNTIKEIYSKEVIKELRNNNYYIKWDFQPFIIDDNIKFLDMQLVVLDEASGTYTPATSSTNTGIGVAICNPGFELNDGTELNGTEYPKLLIPNLEFYTYDLSSGSTSDTEDTTNEFITNYGELTKVVETDEAIDDLSKWLRDQKISLTSVGENGYIDNVVLGREGVVTRINLNSLKSINSDYFINNCTVKGDVILYLLSLEQLKNKFINNLTLVPNATLHIELIMLDKANFENNLATTKPESGITISSPRKLLN